MPIPNLKTILLADAITCSGVFALGLLAAAPVGGLLGLPASVIVAAGWICLAAALLMIVASVGPGEALVKVVALGNLGWVAASFAVVAAFADQMTDFGVVAVIAQAFAVLGFAILEWKGATPRLAAA